MLARVILAVDMPELRRELRRTLSASGLIVKSPRARARLWQWAARQPCDLVITSRSLLPDPPEETVRFLRDLPEAPEVIVLSNDDDPEESASLLASGAAAVLYARLPTESVTDVVGTVLDERRDLGQRALSPERDMARPSLTDFVSSSEAMQVFMKIVRRVVPSDTSLLVLGETGVGKERLARAIHAEGPRGQGPFVAVNCGALPDALLESELFGHEQGAFTGASRSRRGMFELAHGGTIFLDEIGEMPIHLQVKLLRILQDHEIQPVGSEKFIEVDVRVMAASNRDLEDEVAAKRFRRDLYYRIGVVTLTIPPLRERREDIPELVGSYIEHLRPRVGRNVEGITDEAMEALCRYSWPGNVRELINVIERGMLLCDDEITLDDVPTAISGRLAVPDEGGIVVAHGAAAIPDAWLERPLGEVRKDAAEAVERAYLAALLSQTGGRVGQTATRAGIQPRSLYDKMRYHGLRKEDFKSPRPGS